MISAELGKQLESYIQQLVDTGRYGSKSEVLREGVRLVQDRETRLAALDASIMRGIADAALQSVQMQWGWVVLLVGCGLLFAGAYYRRVEA